MSALLIILFTAGSIAFLPSGVLNLRVQETLFPLMGISLFVAGLIFLKANRAVGLLLGFVVVYGLCTYTPDAHSFIMTATAFGTLYLLLVLFHAEIEKRKALIYNLLCVFALLNVLWLILQHFGINIFFHPRNPGEGLATGFFANQNEVSVFLAATLPFFFRRWWHLGIVPVIVGLVLAKTANGAIGAALVMGIYGVVLGLKRYPWKIVLPAVVLAAAALVLLYAHFVDRPGYVARSTAFAKATELVFEKPVMGWGLNQGKSVIPLYLNGDRQDRKYLAYTYRHVLYHEDFKAAYLLHPERYTIDGKQWPQMHNEYLQWTIDTGVVGLFLLLLVIVSHAWQFAVRKLYRLPADNLAFLSFVCLLWACNAFFVLQIGRLAFLMVFVMAMIQGSINHKETDHGLPEHDR